MSYILQGLQAILRSLPPTTSKPQMPKHGYSRSKNPSKYVRIRRMIKGKD